jgi:hypothetical protein
MTQPAAGRPMRILTIGLDRLMTRAVRADFPGARVAACRPLGNDAGIPRGPAPALVVINGAEIDGAAQRAAIRRRWGDAVVVAEFHGRQPVARVWRTPAFVEAVEVGPGFLLPFLPRVHATPRQAALPLTALRMTGYLAILWNLTIGVHVTGMSGSGVTLTILAFAVLVMDLIYRSQRNRQAGSEH